MRQIDDSDLRFILGFEIKQASQSVRKALSSTDQKARDNAVHRIVDRLTARMSSWEILIPEPGVNIFADDPLIPNLGFRFPVKK